MKQLTLDEVETLLEDYLYKLESAGRWIRIYSEADYEYPEYAREQIAEYSDKVVASAKRARQLISIIKYGQFQDEDDDGDTQALAAE